MGALVGAVWVLAAINASALSLGRWLGAACIGLMVAFNLAQVFFRYVIATVLPWLEEALRFLKRWSRKFGLVVSAPM